MSGTAAILASNRAAPTPAVVSNFAKNRFDWETLLTTTSMPTGGAVARAGQAMQYDSTGTLTWAPNNAILWSQDFRNTATAGSSRPWSWGGSTTVATNVSGVTAPDGTSTVSRVSGFSTSDGDVGLSQNVTISPTRIVGSIYVRGESADIGKKVLLRVKRITGTVVTGDTEITLTGDWQRLSSSMTMAADNTGVQFILSGAAASNQASSCLIWGAQLEAVTYSGARDYLPTTDVARFEPRFDVDPATLQPKGLLLEGARTNLQTYSQSFTSWNNGGGCTDNYATSPDGTQNASRWQSGAPYRLSTLTSGATYTISVWAKSTSAASTFKLYGQGGTFSSSTLTTTSGWQRFTFTFTATSTGSVDNGLSSLSGDILLFGYQLEAGIFASSYLPTQASTTSRAAETFTITGYANRLVEAYWIEQETGVASSFPETVVSSGAVTINPPQFGWVTSLRAYQNAYGGDITTPSWIDNSGTNGNRMVTDSTGTLTWAPSNLFSNSASPSQTNTISAGIEGGGDYIVSYYGGGTLVLKQTNSAGAVITLSSTGTVSSRNYAKFTVPNGVSAVYIDFGAATTNAQLERVTYQTQPRALIETSGSARFLPRYDFDGSTTPASPRGMLIEEARTNLILQSQTFNATWVLNNILAFGSGSVADAIVAPDGTTTADKLTPNTTPGAHNFYQSYTYSAGAHTLSVYAKSAGYAFIKLGSMFTGNGVEFNISAGTVGAASAGYTGTITPVGNGWYRCAVTWTASAGADLPGAYIYATTGTNSFAGDGSSGVYLWGAQLELGAFSTSLIPTTTGSVQRVADVVKLSGTALTTLQGAAYSAIVEVAGVKSSAGFGQLLSESSLAFLAVNGGSTTDIYTQLQAGTQVITPLGSGGLTTGTFRAAMSANASGVSVVGNNGTVATSSGTKLTVSNVWIGSRSGSSFAINNPIRAIAVYNSRLPDATLKTKSTVGASF